MAATDARPVPRKNVAFRATFPIYDADGDLVTGATGLDSEVSIDGGTFADATNEATEIATSSGIYYLDLTSGEMNGDTVAVIVKTSSSGAKTTVLVFYPEESGDYRADVTHFGGTAGTFSGGRPEVNTTHAAGTAWGSGAITASALATGAITAAKFAAGAIDAAALAADAVTEIQSGLATAAALDTVDNFLDTEIADIQARLPAALTAGGNMKADVLAISGSTAAADNLEESAEVIATGIASSGTTTTLVASALSPASAVNDQFNGRIIIFKQDTTTAALRGQATDITDFVHATQTFTFTALTTAVANTDTFVIL